MITDQFGRLLRDLRISVTDRCNLRCIYCMPAEVFGQDYAFLPQSELLSFEEIERVARIMLGLGVQKLRLTGGEPLLRRELPQLVERLARLDGAEDLAMTTNGLLLPRYAADLKAAGLQRVTVSLDALDAETFGEMNGLGVSPERVLAGIDAALTAGLGVKLNTVVKRGMNDAGLAEFWRELRGKAAVRFIEFMDVGNHNGWDLEHVVPSAEVLERLAGEDLTFSPLPPKQPGEVARRFVSSDGHEVGLISSVTAPFCGDCSRLRLSATGSLYSCLFATDGYDLKAPLRAGEDDAQLRDRIAGLWQARRDRYSEERGEQTATRPRIEMSFIGG
ncbi:GTP 3',8-cyclase MoaA [Deinococcus sp. Marseille-Q6407]|uniref:GTP 3',8-cyclase MoaA n=1 Tax=Deinococcus sp. Marseille-Q6407 TaxID=2969223 RepID=UPI0021BF483D|nr:GTP 3',8-cyclase MoaA [Deinococcus sp. Marseille-Q6407]